MASVITLIPQEFVKNEHQKQNHNPKQESQKPELEKSAARKEFDRYANSVREVLSVRLRAQGRGGAGGGNNWWAGVPEPVKVYLLSMMAGEDWERWEHVAWGALPDGLRSALAQECRTLARIAAGCPWR